MKYLFIGGSSDGQRCETKGDMRAIVPKKFNYKEVFNVDLIEPIPTEQYIKRYLDCDSIYVLDTISNTEVMQKLLKGYKP